MSVAFGDVVKFRHEYSGTEVPAVVLRVNDGSVDLNVFEPAGSDGARADMVHHKGVTAGTGAGQYSTL
jgi:hypothetical protein